MEEPNPPSYKEMLEYVQQLREMERRLRDLTVYKAKDESFKLALLGLVSASAHLLEELLVH